MQCIKQQHHVQQKEFVSQLVGALSPVNHRGLHQGYICARNRNIPENLKITIDANYRATIRRSMAKIHAQVKATKFYYNVLIEDGKSSNCCDKWEWGGDLVQLVENRTSTSPTQVRFPGAERNCSLRVNFQCRLSYGVRTLPCEIACINICAHIKDPVVHVRVRWIIKKKVTHLPRTVGWIARPCRSQLSPGKATRIAHGKNPNWTIQL